VEIRQVRYFLAVAELKHFGRAAGQLHIVQPAVSQQIRRLEHELGVELFHRTTRAVELTPAGIAFLEHAREIVAAVERAGQAVHHARLSGPVLRIGTGSGLGDLIAEALEELARRQPDLTVELVRLPEQQRRRQLADGRLAAAIVRGAIGPLPDGVQCATVITEPLVAALPSGRTTPRRTTIRLGDLASMPARLPRRDQNAVLSDALIAACQRIGTPLRRIAGGTDEDMLALIATGPPSWTVFYPRKAEVLARQLPRGVAFRRIVSPPVTVTTSVITRTDSPEAQAFAASLRILARPRSNGTTLRGGQ
jgi:DNA-binding transcriptional LysR family regulator